MKKAEIILASFIGVALIFKFMHWPYGSILLTLSTLLLSQLYFYFGFALLNNLGLRAAFKAKSYKGISKLRLFGAIVTGFILSILLIYIMFVLQFWPYGRQGLLIGLSLFGILIGIVLVFHFSNRKQFLKDNYKRFIIIGMLSTLLCAISMNQLVDLYYGSDPAYAEEFKAYLNDDNPNKEYPSRAFNSRIEE